MDVNVIKSQLSTLKKRVSSQRLTNSLTAPEKTTNGTHSAHLDYECLPEDEVNNYGQNRISTNVPSLHNVHYSVQHEPAIDAVGKTLDPAARSEGTGTKRVIPIIKWACSECSNECIPIMRESRCLCGHRMKEHKPSGSTTTSKFPCSSKGCRCAHFFYLVAEGSWILRCRCKHKHTDHDCAPGEHKCSKCSGVGGCSGFDSPWVCNCGHTWSSHAQHTLLLTDDNIDGEIAAKDKKKTFFYRQDGLDG